MKIEYYNEYYIQNSNHYLIPKDVFIELFNEMSNWREEAKELKKQLKKCYCNRTDCSGRIKGSKTYDSLEQKIKNQQKEFIEWLEYEIEKATTNPYTKLSEYGMNRIHIYKEILKKYKGAIK